MDEAPFQWTSKVPNQGVFQVSAWLQQFNLPENVDVSTIFLAATGVHVWIGKRQRSSSVHSVGET